MPYEAVEYFEDNEWQPDNSAERSKLAQEMILQKPGFLEQWALLIFITILMLILTAAWLIRYPDVVEVKATLTAVNAPKEIGALQEGRLVKLFVKNNETVKQNEVLAWIESTASPEEVLALSAQIDSSLELSYPGNFEKIVSLFNKTYTHLGKISKSYQTFITALQNDLRINPDKQLRSQKFQQALQSLKATVDEWKKKYVIEAPVDGKISFIIPLKENQFLQTGKMIGYIIPADINFYAQTFLPQSNFEKVDTGQRVQLRFDAYPYYKFGFVNGTVNYISNIAADSGFLATIRLNRGLITSNNKSIAYENGLKAKAIIITQNRRLLSRLWYNLKRSL